MLDLILQIYNINKITYKITIIKKKHKLNFDSYSKKRKKILPTPKDRLKKYYVRIIFNYYTKKKMCALGPANLKYIYIFFV